MAFRKHTLLPLDDCLYALQASIPRLTRSSLHRLFQRRGLADQDELEAIGEAIALAGRGLDLSSARRVACCVVQSTKLPRRC